MEELQASTGETATEALVSGLMLSDECWTIVDAKGTPTAMFGVGEGLKKDDGVIWLLASKNWPNIIKKVIRSTKPFISRFHLRYRILWNLIDIRHTTSIRWLKWAGFRVEQIIDEFGPEKRPFALMMKEST